MFFIIGLLWSAAFLRSAGLLRSTGILRSTCLFAESPVLDWGLLWSGSWEENKTLHNRGDLKIGFSMPGLVLRNQVIDRHTMNFELDPPWGDPSKGVTNFGGGLYHKPTGSRLLYGVLDEWGLSARVRNPWIRSAPFAENHKPLMAELKTVSSSTKEAETYLYLSSPVLKPLPNLWFRGFVSAQTEAEDFKPAFSGGLDTSFGKNMSLLLETFYTGDTLAATKSSSWFSDSPPLPEREFNLYSLGLIFNSPFLTVSSDWAYSETFAVGKDMYANLGVRITPLLPKADTRSKSLARPLSVSLAVDGAGECFIGRDGVNHGEGFRSAGKIEWKGAYSRLMRINTTLRGPGPGEDFNRSSTGFYYRFPAPSAASRKTNTNAFPVRMTRVSFTADRNASDNQKISDGFRGNLGFSVNLPLVPGFSGADNTAPKSKEKSSPLGIDFSISVKCLTSSNETPFPYPISREPWNFDSAGAGCELSWSLLFFQFRTKWGYTAYAKKEDQWDASFSTAIRFKQGRLSLKAASPDFPDKWNCTVSWRLEKK